MDSQDNSMFCLHCHENVSKSTYRRHQLLGTKRKRTHAAICTFSDSESDSDALSIESDRCYPETTTSEADRAEENILAQSDHEDIHEDQIPKFDIDDGVSDSDLESLEGDEHNENDDGTDRADEIGDDECEEHWDDIPPEVLEKDISSTPLPEPELKKSRLQNVNALAFWFVYFLLFWQSSCKLSDNGLAWLIQFLFQFLKVLGLEISNAYLMELISVLPSSLYLLRTFIDFDRDSFTKYVVCPKCTKLFSYDYCLISANNRTVAKTCCNTYLSRGQRKRCDATLVKRVILKDGKEQFYPIKYFCYNSIINELERLLLRNGLPDSCEEWRQDIDDGEDDNRLLKDVYSGQLWNDFQTYKGKDFLKEPRNYGFMLNFDFFQPMKHRKDYSVGVFYLVLLNLPRNQRFKWENVIVVGIVPSMDGEPKNLNEFLQPAVVEFQRLWKGIRLKSCLSSTPLTFRAALLSVSADIPAARKLCGFKGHSAKLGCSRCLKEFPGGFGVRKDYSGFDRNSWAKRNNRDHRRNAKNIKKCTISTKRNALSKKYGINYWSVLLDLEYFDVVRFCTVDPMHNLFLGTAKHVFKVWDKKGIITKKQMKVIEKRIEEMEVPTDIGRLPKKISSNYGSYTAEQWKNWTLIYSIYALDDVIGVEHIRCWQSFVLACKYLCRSTLSKLDLERADLLLLKFCKEFENLYGNNSVTPNMHLHCHLRDIIVDHGPIYSFWCFSFERYNGIMGSVSTNKRSLELQLMRKLALSRYLDGLQLPQQYTDQFQHLFSTRTLENTNSKIYSRKEVCIFQSMCTACPLSSVDWSVLSQVTFPSEYKLQYLDKSDLEVLLIVYKSLYPDQVIEAPSMAETMKKFATISIGGQLYGSKLHCRSMRSARIYASWAADDEGLNVDKLIYIFGMVHFYFSHSMILNGNFVLHCFACVSWHKPDENPDRFGNPTKTCKANDFLPGGPSSFMPVQRIHGRYSAAEVTIGGEQKIVTVPLETRIW